jgi:hypothetical protein
MQIRLGAAVGFVLTILLSEVMISTAMAEPTPTTGSESGISVSGYEAESFPGGAGTAEFDLHSATRVPVRNLGDRRFSMAGFDQDGHKRIEVTKTDRAFENSRFRDSDEDRFRDRSDNDFVTRSVSIYTRDNHRLHGSQSNSRLSRSLVTYNEKDFTAIINALDSLPKNLTDDDDVDARQRIKTECPVHIKYWTTGEKKGRIISIEYSSCSVFSQLG